jgi:hypothetical protein
MVEPSDDANRAVPMTDWPIAGGYWRSGPETGSDGVTVRMLKDAADAAAFRALNEEWIARHFVLEERDHRQLDNPVAAKIDTGGAILIAELDGRPIGCVALAPDGTGARELSKMAVVTELRRSRARACRGRSRCGRVRR